MVFTWLNQILLCLFFAYFAIYVKRKIEIEISTIVPLGAELKMYDEVMPQMTETTDTTTEIRAVLLNPLPSIIAVMLGITISDEISKIPTNLIEAITVKLARIMKR